MTRVLLSLLCLASSWCAVASSQVANSQTAPEVESDSAIVELVRAYEAGEASREQKLQLLGVVLRDPQRLRAISVNPDSTRRDIIDEWGSEIWRHDEPRAVLARCFAAYANGDEARCDSLFQIALRKAPSDKARADYFYARAQRGYGGGGCEAALQLYPTHGPCLYTNLTDLGRAVGRQTTVEGRFTYWCLADRFRQLADIVDDTRIASAARTAASRYEQAAPTRERWEAEGYTEGQIVTVELANGETCQTPVR